MGKSLKGKELGKGIGQRKDGLYYARCTNKSGQRLEKCFQDLKEARNWQKEQQYRQVHPEIKSAPPKMTVNEWFDFWQTNLLAGLAPNTVRNYRERYERNAKAILGELLLTEVKLLPAPSSASSGVWAATVPLAPTRTPPRSSATIPTSTSRPTSSMTPRRPAASPSAICASAISPSSLLTISTRLTSWPATCLPTSPSISPSSAM